MAGDQCSEPSQSGGSYQSEDPAGVVPSSAEKQVPKQLHSGGILKTALEAEPPRRNGNTSVQFQNGSKRSQSMARA